jgi:hypothetical protein
MGEKQSAAASFEERDMPAKRDKSTKNLQDALKHTREMLANSEEAIRRLREALARTETVIKQQSGKLTIPAELHPGRK